MKNLILLSKTMLLVLFVACSNTETIDPVSSDFSPNGLSNDGDYRASYDETQETYEWFIHQQFLNNELYRLREQEAQLMEEIENGNEHAIPELEAVQEEIALNEKYLEYLGIQIDPLPPPPKPNPCEYGNCPIDVNRTHIFSATENQSEINFTIVNNDNEPVGEVTDIFETNDPYRVNYLYECGYEGEFTLVITKYFEPAGTEITYQVPVIVN